MLWIIDRIVDGVALCEGEDRKMRRIVLADLPVGVQAGDCLREVDGIFVPDEAQTQKRRQEAVNRWRKVSGKQSDSE